MRNVQQLAECEKPSDSPKKGGKLNMSGRSKTKSSERKQGEDGGTELWDDWNQSSPLSALLSTSREDLQCSGVHVHTHTRMYFTHTVVHTHMDTCIHIQAPLVPEPV